MQTPSDLRRYAERVLIGTDLSVDDAVLVASGNVPDIAVPQACAAALRDGWAASQLEVDEHGAVAS